MKIYHLLSVLFGIIFSIPIYGQNAVSENDGTLPLPDKPANKDARFYRPFIFQKNTSAGAFSMGGYASANTQYFVTDGEGEGLHFQFRDFHLFTQSSFLNERMQFVTDIAFDPATQQLNITEAALNIRFHKAFNLRGGVVLPPLGYFNQNGDSPNTDFVDWALSSTTIIPSRLSEVGFGLNGNVELNDNMELTYELYAVNGLQEGVTDNDLPRTAIDLGKTNLLGADNNGKLAYTGRMGLQQKEIGEIGFSFYTGAYNVTEIDETEIDEPRNLSILAIDGQTEFQKISIKGEVAFATIDVYEGLGQLFGEKQMGYHVEASYPILENVYLLGQDNNRLNIALRFEHADYNVDTFEQTETKIYDELMGLRAGLALRMGNRSVIKANYSYFWEKDILGNAAETGGVQFGISSYF